MVNQAMINRRSLLIGIGSLAFSAFMSGCSRAEEQSLRVRVLKGSIPAQLLKEFQRQTATKTPLNFSADAQLADLYDLLQTWKQGNQPAKPGFSLPFAGPKSVAIADLVTLGDYWLTTAIQQGLIQPLDLDGMAEWQQLPPLWQSFVRRDRQGQLSDQGAIWAAPYRWGTLMLVYRKDKFQALGWTPQDWKDLWRPEVRGRISLLDSPRSVIGLTLKKLGQSINAENLEAIANLTAELSGLQQQVKFYSSDAYLQALIVEDTWLAVGWSNEILPLLERNRELAAVIPESGTILTADLWVRPAAPQSDQAQSADRLALLNQWIQFCWQPQPATQISLLTSVASPRFAGLDTAQLPNSLQQNRLLLPPKPVLQRSEFLLPLADSAIDQYRHAWTMMRRAS